MKYLALLLALLFPLNALAVAVGYDNKTAGNTGATAGTSLSFSHTNTAGNMLVVVVNARLFPGGCSAPDVTDLSVTYNGVAMSFDKGSTSGGVVQSCVHAYLLHLANPATGANTLALSWTSTAHISVVAYTFTNASASLGTIVEDNGTGSFSASQTITANDMLFGGLGIADQPVNWSMANSNVLETGDAVGYTGASGETNTGSGSVNVSGTYAVFEHVFWAVPILEYVAPLKGYTEIVGARINDAKITGQP